MALDAFCVVRPLVDASCIHCTTESRIRFIDDIWTSKSENPNPTLFVGDFELQLFEVAMAVSSSIASSRICFLCVVSWETF